MYMYYIFHNTNIFAFIKKNYYFYLINIGLYLLLGCQISVTNFIFGGRNGYSLGKFK